MSFLPFLCSNYSCFPSPSFPSCIRIRGWDVSRRFLLIRGSWSGGRRQTQPLQPCEVTAGQRTGPGQVCLSQERTPVQPLGGHFPNWDFLSPQCCVVPLQLWRTLHPSVPIRLSIMSMLLCATSVMKDLPNTMWPSSGARAMASGTGPRLSAPNVSRYPQIPQHKFLVICSL